MIKSSISKDNLKQEDLNKWDLDSGTWYEPAPLWALDQGIPDGAPDCWLSSAGGDYYLGMSFHLPPFTIPKGNGTTSSGINYHPSSFVLARNQDPYNSWGVNAVKNEFSKRNVMTFWDWLPGVTLYDTSIKYTLPSPELSAFAGTEWADNDSRVFHGLNSNEVHANVLTTYLRAINEITGPGFAGWPFGYRQLAHAVIIWIHSKTKDIHSMLLAGTVQSSDRFHYANHKLYFPGDELGAWLKKPPTWDCRQVLKFFYKSRLLLRDGFHEIALVAASSAVETAFYEIVLFLEANNVVLAKNKIKQNTFMNRANLLIASYGYVLPSALTLSLRNAYKARNSIAHELNSFSHEMASQHINGLESVIEWYFEHI